MCIIGPKAYNGLHQYIERHLQTDDLRQENGQPEEGSPFALLP
jgi:hypothetical protein